jgi:hypothetical protein
MRSRIPCRRPLVAPLLALACTIADAGKEATAQPLPFPSPIGAQISPGLPAGFESSGLAWHPELRRLFVCSDDGRLAAMEADGSLVQLFPIGGDLEGIAHAPPRQDRVYLAIEDPDSIVEFDFAAGVVTRTFDLTPWLTGEGNKGLEGLAFVPDAADPEGGTFLAGKQDDGKVRRFRLPIVSSESDVTPHLLETFAPIPGRIDLRGIDYDGATDSLWMSWVDFNRISRHAKDGTLLAEWTLPPGKPEGIALVGCELFVADDATTPRLSRYHAFPEVASCRPLTALASRVSVVAGNAVSFVAVAPPELRPGDSYLLIGSASGVGAGKLPVMPDAYFALTVAFAGTGPFARTAGILGADRSAWPTILVPPGASHAFVGLELHHAWLGFDAGSGALKFASRAERL